MSQELLMYGIQIVIMSVLPLLGAALIGGIIGGLLRLALRIDEEIVSYACKLGACSVCGYLLFPTVSTALLTLTEDILKGAW